MNVWLKLIEGSLISGKASHTWWRHQMEIFLRHWPFVRGIHRSPVNSPRKGQWHRALMFSMICVWINGCVNNHEAGDLRRHRTHYDVTVMYMASSVDIDPNMKMLDWCLIELIWGPCSLGKPSISGRHSDQWLCLKGTAMWKVLAMN